MFLASLDEHAMISIKSKELCFWTDCSGRNKLALSDLSKGLSFGQHRLTIEELVLTFGGEWGLHQYKQTTKTWRLSGSV